MKNPNTYSGENGKFRYYYGFVHCSYALNDKYKDHIKFLVEKGN